MFSMQFAYISTEQPELQKQSLDEVTCFFWSPDIQKLSDNTLHSQQYLDTCSISTTDVSQKRENIKSKTLSSLF